MPAARTNRQRLDALLAASAELADACDALSFAEPVTHVYNPLRHAARGHEAYLRRWGGRRPEAVLVGMNPGPYGMAQTGVPFGDVGCVRDWLGIDVTIDRPAREHPKRPVHGFACPRGEVSGQRLWGWARDRFGTPAAFLSRFLILNSCPLVFMEESGRNRTPDKLPVAEREPLLDACDRALGQGLAALRPRLVVGIGAWAEQRARAALDRSGVEAEVGRILHPSPASPIANRGWAEQAERQLEELGVDLP